MLCAVVALVLLMVLLQSRGALASTQEALTRAESKAARSSTDAAAERSRASALEGELAQTLAIAEALEDQQTSDKAHIEQLNTQVGELESKIAEAAEAHRATEAALAERADALAETKAQVAAQQEAATANDERNLTLTHQNEELQVQLIEAADEAAKRNAPSVPSILVSDDGSDLDVPGFSPGMAWELELVRSDRTWRYSVAANPVEDPSPFTNTVNPLKLAIEIEALALREDVGAFIGIDWQAGTDIDPSVDPARAHLTLRLAQELLASAAREMSPSTLIVTSDDKRGGVSLEVVASDPDDVDFKIPPPPIASEWIGIDEHGGMVVTVRSAN